MQSTVRAAVPHVRVVRATYVQFYQCCRISGPFQGKIEGVNSTWQPKGRLLDHQNALPYQPVPPLQQTITRFLDSVRPIYNDEIYNRAVRLTEEFGKKGGVGERLQALLIQRAEAKENWSADWLIRVAYLGYRDPVSCYISPSVVAPPMKQFKGPGGQLRCAGMSISAALEYRKVIDEQTIPIEKIGAIPQCMIQHHHVFGACRVPGENVDWVDTVHAEDPDSPRHITVLHNNHVFHVDVYDEQRNPLSILQIYAQLESVISQSPMPLEFPVSAMTNANRDDWYEVYTKLSEDVQNAANFKSIHKSLFALSLDQPVQGYSQENHYNVMIWHYLAGGGIHHNTGNRWCDKTCQYFVNTEGVFGFIFEHSVSDGPPALNILKQTLSYLNRPEPEQQPAPGSYPEPRRLDFNITPDVETAITAAADNITQVMNQIDVAHLYYKKYGRDFIKQMKLFPDSYIQANMQLAYYKMYGHLVSTYESGSLRKFRLGRTESIRSASIPVHKWCQAMVNNSVSAEEKVRLLKEAIYHHRWYTNEVVQGQMIDKHLLGLKLTALENNIEIPEFFNDYVYTQSVHWTLSTSTVPLANGGVIIFGPVVEDGYGICYTTQKSYLEFGMTAWNTCKTNDVRKLRDSLESALDDTQNILLQTNKL